MGVHAQNLYAIAKKDYFVCPMRQHMVKKTGTTKRKSDNGYVFNAKYLGNKELQWLSS